MLSDDAQSHPVDVAVGVRMRALRGMKGLSQAGLARALGVSFQQVQKYETGRNRISASKLFDAARVLDVPISEFFSGAVGPDDEVDAARDTAAIREITHLARMLRPDHQKLTLGLVRALASAD